MDRYLNETVVSPEPRRAAIDRVLEREQVRSVFQPIIDLDSGAVVAYEALARGPAGPLERPDELFAAARAAGRLTDLDELCRRAAIRGAIDAGIYAPLTLFLNVEPEILDVAPLAELLGLADRAPGDLRLVLEITERALAARPAQLLASVRQLRAAGWRIALDDVGANDLSLAFLPVLRPDIVKLDLQLVQRRPGPKVAEIMNAVNAYAERTGSVILAEGVEDQEHLAIARALGARLGQGWMFGRPGPGLAAGLAIRALALPPMSTGIGGASPFECLPPSVELRHSTKPLLIEVSKHLEREARRLGGRCIVMSTFQRAPHFSPITARRYSDLANHVGFVAALGAGLAVEPATGVRGADLEPGDPIRREWDVVVLAPHFAAALLARDLQTPGPDMLRSFEFALTYDRRTVEAAAESLMSRVRPSSPPASDDAEFEPISDRDPLTGLLSRGRLLGLVESIVLDARMAERGAALLYLDIDGFEALNGRHGHPAGDTILRVTASRLQRRLRRGDLIARVGGDEFVVVLPGLDQADANAAGSRVATQLAAELAAPIHTNDELVTMAVSIGVSAFPADGDGFDALLHAAESRMSSGEHGPHRR